MLQDGDIKYIMKVERDRRERKKGSSTYGLVISLTVGQSFFLIVPATFKWFLTVGTHKVLEEGGGGGG